VRRGEIDVRWIPSLIGGGFVKLGKYRRDPAVGLKVTITGRHHLHGYNAIIRDVVQLGENGPESFRVEVEATHKLETVRKSNLVVRT
jgi:transcription elongation factor